MGDFALIFILLEAYFNEQVSGSFTGTFTVDSRYLDFAYLE